MDYISVKARAKINLTLDVIGKRPDGYHDLRMIMQTVELYDKVYIKKIEKPIIKVKTNLEWLPTDNRNLVYKAAELIKERYSIKKGIFIDLFKTIPVAAGLAGGSADCAAALYALNRLYDLKLSHKELSAIGLELGSDVPYCLMRGTALAEGRGEILTRLPSCPQLWVVLAKPPVGISTATVYKAIDKLDNYCHPDTEGMIEAIKNNDINGISSRLNNVLEYASIPMCSMVADIKAVLKANNALGVLMSGSGPTAYGLFDNRESAEAAAQAVRDIIKIKDVFTTKIFNTQV